MSNIETVVRQRLCETLKRPAGEIGLLNLDEHLMYEYGLASLDLIMLMSAVCNDAGVPLTEFDEDDIAKLQTPSDIVKLLTSKAAN